MIQTNMQLKMKIKNEVLIMEEINKDNIDKETNETIEDNKIDSSIEERLKIVESLVGILEGSDVTLEEAREERVKKYL